jgi:hypothetical protein
MRASALTLLCIAAVCLPALAQNESPGGQQEYRYVARVTGNNVNVRARPDIRYGYRCAQVSRPQTVKVVEELDGWLKILPTDDCFSVVSQDYVRVEPGSRIGRVTGDRVRVRAGGELRSRSFNVVQGYLNRGQQVRVIGTVNDPQANWYKIEPPLGAAWYISAQYVERGVGGAERATPRREPDRPSVRQPRRTAPTTSAASPGAEGTAAEREAAEAFQAAEEALKAEYERPLLHRDLVGLLERYQSIDVPEDSALEAYVDARIAHLRRGIQRQEAYRQAQRLAQETAEQQRQYEIALARIQSQTPEVEKVARYDAEGVLVPSEIFTGAPTAAKRFTLRDTLSRRINAYVQCTTGEVDLSRHVGKKVGVFGRKSYNADLQLHVVEVEKVVVLAESPHLPEPSRPTVIPRPRLTPVKPPEEQEAEEPVEEPAEEPAEPQAQPPEPPTEEPAEQPGPSEPAPQPTTRPAEAQPSEPSDDGEPRVIRPDAPTTRPAATTRPTAATKPSEPVMVVVSRPIPASQPTTAATRPLPRTGLEMVTPQTRQAPPEEQLVPEEEYD